MRARSVPGGRRTTVAAGVLVVLLLLALAFWAGRTTLRSPDAAAQAPRTSAQVQVVERELGRVITLTTTVRRAAAPLAVNALPGVVTQVADDGTHDVGDVLYRVGGAPVVLAEGSTPFWRDLGEGDRGQDVRQVQRMLNHEGASLSADGTWRATTTAAVKAWQQRSGAAASGTIRLGELVAAPTTPVAIDLDRKVLWRGAALSGGETVLSVPDGEPRFVMQLTPGQVDLVPSGTAVTVHGEGQDFAGVSGDAVEVDGGFEVPVTAPDGSVLCGRRCAAVPASGETYLLTDVAVRAPVKGPVVPVAAVRTAADGTTSVTVVDGGDTRPVQVTVETVADGLAVVRGVEPGAVVRVFGDGGSEGGGVVPAPTSSPGTTAPASPEPTPGA